MWFRRVSFLCLFGVLFIGFASKSNALPLHQLSQQKPILLNKGGWVFYFNSTYQDIQNNPALVPEDIIVPGPWGYLGHPDVGYGTYVYRFTHDLKKDDIMVLKMMTIGTAYDLFINGKKSSSVGVFATNKENSKPNFRTELISFDVDIDTVEIAVQVCNYHYREGGIWFAPSLGMPKEMEALKSQTTFMDSFLVGSLFVLFCYFVAFYYIKTEDKTSLMFASMCFFAALRIASTGDILIRELNLSIPWEMLVKFEYLSLAFMLLFGVYYIESLFPKDVNKKVLNFITYVQVPAGIFFLLTPVCYSSHVIPYYLIFCGFLLLYMLNLVIKIILNKRPFALWVGGAYLVVFVAGINDILYSQSIIKSFYLMPEGIFIFAIVQALTLTRLFSNAFKEVENLSDKLQNINKNQKEIIHERTSLLNMQAQELQRSNQIKDKVFSIIAHDLRAPIKSLSTVLTWVAEDDLPMEDLKKSLGSISKNVDTLNLTLENLLQWSRSQLNGVKSEPELIDIRKPVQEMMDLYKIQVAEKGIRFKYSIPDRFAVYVDKHHLNLLLRNIISNAIKFTRDGGEIEISASTYNQTYTLVSIKDNGVGMSAEAIEKVFSAVDHYTTYGTNNEKGTGLGLLLCKEYIDNSNGKIWIESQLGSSTNILFTLPNFAS
ncbi:MAG: hypothetical protein CFE21_17125 [Bacteroidetes bacterium B1(2017)]|nr:MAG: hypothetical protein CFE21_17125 [Bacteroidetes bacterium B1(2017)]